MKKTLNIRIPINVFNTLEELRERALREDNLTFYQINTGSMNQFIGFVISMGLIKIKQDFKKWEENLENEK